MKRVCAIMTICFVSTSVLGQKLDDNINDTISENIYYSNLTDKFTFKLLAEHRNNSFNISDTNNQNKTRFVPNDALTIGLGFNYKFIGLSATFIPISAKRESEYGKTQKLDLQANFYTKKFGFDIRLDYYQGFYVENPQDFNSSIPIDNQLKRSDIQSLSIGTDLFYIFNSDEFSFRNTLTNNEWQKKSAGSFYSGIRFAYFSMEGDTILGPIGLSDSLKPNAFVKKINAYSAGVFGGYAYTLVFAENFFVSAGIAPTISILGGNETKTDGRSFNLKNIGQVGYTIRGGMGYNSERYFAGVSVFIDQTNLKFANIEHNRQLFRFYIGTRIF